MKLAPSLTSTLHAQIGQALLAAGGWIGFERFMALALYTPGLGYYANDCAKFGAMPRGPGATAVGSDFVTAPELSPYFGRALARQVAQALQMSGSGEIWEFGAGSGALALQLLDALGPQVQRYHIVELSGTLAQRQRELLQRHLAKISWEQQLPAAIEGVVLGNEVLDAMPVTLLQRRAGTWRERGVALDLSAAADAGEPACGEDLQHGARFTWQDRATMLRPPIAIDGEHDYLSEIHPQAQAFIRSVAGALRNSARGGTALFIDYGFPEREYYHAQRHMGTLMCHRAHRMDADPLADVGLKDITAHVDFSAIALAAHQAGMALLGYTSQARFLMNCGLLELVGDGSIPERAMVQKLIHEHEMGELFKVIGFCTGEPWEAIGFAQGDRLHTL